MKDETKLPPLKKAFQPESELQEIYRWLPYQCNAKALDRLIDHVQALGPVQKKETPKTGTVESKVRSIRKAVGHGFIERADVVKLLRDCEECGQQWIYLFKPKKDDEKILRDPHSMLKQLFPTETPDFSSFTWPKSSIEIVDFRTEKKDGWILKLYEHSIAKKNVDSKRGEKRGNGVFRDWVDYEYQDAYLVHVIRWTPSKCLLEVRIDKEKSFGRKSTKDERWSSLVDKMLPALNLAGFQAWPLEERCTDFLVSRQDRKDHYRFGHVRLETYDKGKGSLFPYSAKEELDSDTGRSNAVDSILRNQGRLLECCINFKVTDGMQKPESLKEGVDNEVANDDELRTVVGGQKWNEISISSRISPELLNHVINSLC